MWCEPSNRSTRKDKGVVYCFDSPELLDRFVRVWLEQARSRGPVVFLDSQLQEHAACGPGYIASDPLQVLQARAGQGAWEQLRAFRASHADAYLFGWLGYDLKNEIETLESRNTDYIDLPDLFFMVPGVLLELDRANAQVSVVCSDGLPETEVLLERTCEHIGSGEPPARSTGQGAAAYTESRAGADPSKTNNATETPAYELKGLISLEGWTQYRAKVQCIKAFIEQGDTYEVNFTHPLKGHFKGDSLDLFAAMRKRGPVPFGAWVSLGETQVCCASPERFLQKQADRLVSQPIKGTSPRSDDPYEDAQLVQRILRHEKNRAENVMIVDLVRHDLSQVCEPGSVHVPELLHVQSFATVHQLVSTVAGVLRPEVDAVQAIKACFPMGSMTGAPKIRTMQIIEQLELYRRGIYSGAIGYMKPDGDFDFNVVIRTAIIRGEELYYPVGGAITSDSDAREEWEECLVKARALAIFSLKNST